MIRSKYGLRLALVKQATYGDLYATPIGYPKPYMASLLRTGPMAFFAAFDADFICVEVDSARECQIYKQKVGDCGHRSVDYYENEVPRKSVMLDGREVVQGDIAVDSRTVDWSKYDLVVSVDISVPSDVVASYPGTLWCYYISEPCMAAYKVSKYTPICGYDVFLNQMFRPESESSYHEDRADHVIEFPYCFLYPYIFHDLFGFERQDSLEKDRLDVTIPKYVAELLTSSHLHVLNEVANVTILGGDLQTYLRALCSGDIYLRLGNSAKFGNETTEAVCAGNLFLSSTRGWKNRVFNIPGTFVDGNEFSERQFESAIDHIRRYSDCRDDLLALRARQQEIAKELCYERPLRDLVSAYERKVTQRAKFRGFL